MSDKDTCPSCGVPFEDHLGLIGTCAKLQHRDEWTKELVALVGNYLASANADIEIESEAYNRLLEHWSERK